jgi:hypothetical protein
MASSNQAASASIRQCPLLTRRSELLHVDTNICHEIASFHRPDLIHPVRDIGGHRGSTDRCPCPTNSLKNAPTSPHCPACAQVMRLARITSRFGDLPDLYTFECRACGVSHIEPALSASIIDALLLGASKKDLWTLATSQTYDA